MPILVGFLCDVKFVYRQTFVAGALYFGTIRENKTLANFFSVIFSLLEIFTVGLWLVGASRRELAGVTDVFRIRRTVAGCKKCLYTHTAPTTEQQRKTSYGNRTSEDTAFQAVSFSGDISVFVHFYSLMFLNCIHI